TLAGLVRLAGSNQNDMTTSDPVLKAVLCLRNDTNLVAIISTVSFSESREDGDCLQVGPVLIEQGREGDDLASLDSAVRFAFADGSFQRSFLVVNSRNEVTLGVASPLSLWVLREVLRRPESQGGFDASSAVGLSGSSTAGLVIQGDHAPLKFGNTQTLL